MQILGIKEYGIKKYQTGTQKGGIQPQSEEERYDQYLEQMKKQYPGTYINQTPIWSSINPSKEIKSYREFLEELKTSNPEEYNRLMEASAQSETSEISKPWIDSEGNVRRSTNVSAGFVPGTDPIMQMYVEGVTLNPVFKAIGTTGLYGLGRLGNNWARAKLISNTMNQSLRTPQVIMPNNVGWGPKQRIPITHSSTTGEMGLFYPKRWDVVQEGANPHGIWLQGKLGIPRTEITNPGKGMKAQKARQLFADMPYQLKGEVELDKPIVTVGEVPNRSWLSYYADNAGADGLIYNGVYDNGYNANQVILSYKLPSITNYERLPYTKYSVDADIPSERDLVMKHWNYRYPNSGLKQNRKVLDLGNGELIYKEGDLPLHEDVVNISNIMESRINNFPARNGYDLEWNYMDGVGIVPGGKSGYFKKIREGMSTLFFPTSSSNNYEGFHNGFGSFIKANPWRPKPYSYTQLHEQVSHGTDRLAKELVTPVSNKPVMSLYERISNPTDLFDDLSFMDSASKLPVEARSTNWEMIMKLYKELGKKLGKNIQDISPEEFNSFVDQKFTNSTELANFMDLFNNQYLKDYGQLLRKDTSGDYLKRIKNMIKYGPILTTPIIYDRN